MSLEQARIYLERVVPWQEGAHVNLHWTVPNRKFDSTKPEGRGNKRFYLNGQAFTSSQGALDQLGYLVGGRSEARDIYACMSAQTVAVAKVMGQRSFLEAKRGTDNVAGIKALYIDLDVKAAPKEGEKAYPNATRAFSEMRRFIAEVGLPRPTLAVASGTGGAHLYWVLDRVLPRDEWQPLANALAEATRRHGLTIDTQCTVDSARILRVPQTWNHKGTPPLPVTLGRHIEHNDVPLDDVRRVLLPYMGATVHRLPTAAFPGGKPVTTTNEFTAGIQAPSAPPVDIDTVKPLCGFVATALDTGGAGYAQPLWNLTTLLATFTQSARGDGRWAAHEMAKGHPGYAHPDTDALYDRKVAERDAKNIGWPSCAAVQNAGCLSCAACPLQAFNRSPLSWGKPSAVAGGQMAAAVGQATVAPPGVARPALPVPYVFSAAGLVLKAVLQDDQTTKLIEVSPYPMHSAWVQQNPWILHFQAQLRPHRPETQIGIPLMQLQAKEFAKHLAAQGLVVARHQAQLLQDFLMAWILDLQATRDAVVSSSPFGWAVLDGRIDGFVYAGRTWTPGADKPAASPDAVLASQYSPCGSIDPWREAAKFITDQRRPALDMILAASFGAPLMRFTGQSGAVMSAYSVQSGIGKSTAMEVSQAVWGHPKKAMNALNDTQNSAINKAGQLRSLPLMWDELKGEDQKDSFVRLAFQISGGKEKSRLNSDTSQRSPGTWQTIVMAASNDSLFDTVQRQVGGSDAGAMRVFEFEVPPGPPGAQAPHGVVSRLVAQCHDNYGQAGLAYAKFLGANHEAVAKRVGAAQDALAEKLDAKSSERFWIATMACCLIGAEYANKLGLTDIDVAGLGKLCVQTVKDLRRDSAASTSNIKNAANVEAILAEFIGEMAAKNTLVTDVMPNRPGRPNPCKVNNHNIQRLEVIYVRHAEDDKVLVVNQGEFYRWLGKRKLNSHTFMQALTAALPGQIQTNIKKNLGAGTQYAAHEDLKTYCIVFDYGKSIAGRAVMTDAAQP